MLVSPYPLVVQCCVIAQHLRKGHVYMQCWAPQVFFFNVRSPLIRNRILILLIPNRKSAIARLKA